MILIQIIAIEEAGIPESPETEKELAIIVRQRRHLLVALRLELKP